MTTAERMKARRKELGMSAEYVAEKLGYSPATVYRWERGDIEKMPMDILEPLAAILATTPAYLMGWDDDSPLPSNILPSPGIYMEFKDKIKARRLELGMTLDDVARLVGVSNPTISRWESGAIVNQRRDKIELLARALQLSPGELMGWGEGPPPVNNASFDAHLTPAEERMIESYRRAPQQVRDIVDVALAPYAPTSLKDAAM